MLDRHRVSIGFLLLFGSRFGKIPICFCLHTCGHDCVFKRFCSIIQLLHAVDFHRHFGSWQAAAALERRMTCVHLDR